MCKLWLCEMLFRTVNSESVSRSYTKSEVQVLLMPRLTLAEPQCYVRLPRPDPIAMCEILVPDALIASPQYYLRHHYFVARALTIGSHRALVLSLVYDRISLPHLPQNSTHIKNAHNQYTPTRSRVAVKLAQYSSRKISFMT